MAFYLETPFLGGGSPTKRSAQASGEGDRGGVNGAFNQAIDQLIGNRAGTKSNEAVVKGTVAEKTVETVKNNTEEATMVPTENEVSGAVCDGEAGGAQTPKVGDEEPKRESESPKNRCEICNVGFTGEAELFEHMGSHENCHFACGKCELIFENWKLLKEHMPVHEEGVAVEQDANTTGEVVHQYQCVECGKAFTLKKLRKGSDSALPQQCTKCYLKAHMMANANNSYRCLTCGKLFDAKATLAAHMKAHDLEKYKCAPCSRSFAEGEELDQHNALFHRGQTPAVTSSASTASSTQQRGVKTSRPISHELEFKKFKMVEGTLEDRGYDPNAPGSKALTCMECHETFTSMAELRLHVRKHVKRFRCKTCGVGFDKRRQLMAHQATHNNGNRQQQILQPLGGENLSGESLDHLQTVYQCSHCSSAFVNVQDLNVHMALHMTENNQGTGNGSGAPGTGEDVVLYECSECSLRFLNIDDVNQHMTTHGGEEERTTIMNHGNNNKTIMMGGQENGSEVVVDPTYYNMHPTQNEYYTQGGEFYPTHNNTEQYAAQSSKQFEAYAQVQSPEVAQNSRYPTMSQMLVSPPPGLPQHHFSPTAASSTHHHHHHPIHTTPIKQEVVTTTTIQDGAGEPVYEEEEKVKFRSIVQTMCSLLNSGPPS